MLLQILAGAVGLAVDRAVISETDKTMTITTKGKRRFFFIFDNKLNKRSVTAMAHVKDDSK